MNQAVMAGKSATCDVKFKQFPGQPPHWERLIYTLPQSDSNDAPTDAYGVGMDITAEKLRQQQYDKELQMLHTAVNTNLLSKCHFDLIDNKLLIENGELHLTGICSVAGLGPDTNRRRDGSVEYYLSEPVVSDDSKGVGPFMMAYAEYLRLEG